MRGTDARQEGMFSYISPEARVPADLLPLILLTRGLVIAQRGGGHAQEPIQ